MNLFKWQFEVYAGPKSLVGLRADGDDSYSELLFHSLWNWMRGLALGLLWLLEVLYALIPSWGAGNLSARGTGSRDTPIRWCAGR